MSASARARVAMLASAIVLLFAARAYADDADDARAALRRGLSAYEQGDVENALAEYQRAKELAPGANAPWFHAAEALLRLGRHREAVENFEGYLAKNPNVSDALEVRQRIAELRAKHFPGRVHLSTNASDALIFVDGVEKGPPGTLELAPGPHRLEVRRPSGESATAEVVVVGDRDEHVSLPIPHALAPTTPAQPSPKTAQPSPETTPPSSMLSTLGWIVAGAGLVTLGTTFVVDATILGDKITDYETAADRHDVAARDLHGDVTALQTAVIVGYMVGAVLTIGGVSTAIIARPRSTRAMAWTF